MTHILGSDCVNDRSRSKEEQCLEEGVVDHVHDSCCECCSSEEEELFCVCSTLKTKGDHVCSRSECEDHVSKLGQSGVCEDSLDVHVVECHGCSVDCGESTDDCNDDHNVAALNEQGEGPCNEVDTCLDHGCCVNERGDSGGSGHCVRKPVVQGELCGLSNDSCEHCKDCDGEEGGVLVCDCCGVCEDCCVIEGSDHVHDHEESGHETDVSETSYEECLLCCGRCPEGSLVTLGVSEAPESDEQVGTKSHDLPEHEHLEVVAGNSKSEHSGKEEGDFCVVPGLLLALVIHVSDGVDEDQSGDEGCEEHHDTGQ